MFQTASQSRFWIVLGFMLVFAGNAFAQHSIGLGITNVRPTGYFWANSLANFAGVNLDYQYRFKPKLPCIFAGITVAHFPAIDHDMDKRFVVHDPFGRFPRAQMGALMLGVRQDLRQKRSLQPYLELGGAAYLLSVKNDPDPNPIHIRNPNQGILWGGLGGAGIRFLRKSGFMLGLHTRLHVFASLARPSLFANFEWGGFLGYTFPKSGKI